MAVRSIITGGAGFIGSHLARVLRARGDDVLLIDNLATGLRDNVADLLGPGCEFLEADAGRAMLDPAVADQADEIYHLAAAVGVRLITDDPSGMIHNNVEVTRVVLEAAQRAGASVLIASSSEVYGKCPVLPLREDMDLVFGPTTASRWSYGLTKAIDEHLALDMAKRSGLAAVVVRLFNTVGPRQRGTYGMVVPRFVQSAINQQPIEIYGDGQQTRSFCDVRDVAAAMPRLLGEAACHGRVFNLGSDQPMTIEALADEVLALTGSIAGKRFTPYEAVYGAGFEDPRHRQPDLTAIRAAIGFAPRFNLQQTLADMIRSQREPSATPTRAAEDPA